MVSYLLSNVSIFLTIVLMTVNEKIVQNEIGPYPSGYHGNLYKQKLFFSIVLTSSKIYFP